jgi:hypothetical protein
MLGSRREILKIEDGSFNSILNCKIGVSGKDSLFVSGFNQNIIGNEVFLSQQKGISVMETTTLRGFNEGNRAELKKKQNILIKNNYIHDISLEGIILSRDTYGINISHNKIINIDSHGILYRGNDHFIEYNDISYVSMGLDDNGGIYTGFDYLSRGTVIRYNYIHDFDIDSWESGIYLDGAASGQIVYGNVIENVPHCIFSHGGSQNKFYNNVLINCRNGMAYLASASGVYNPSSWWHDFLLPPLYYIDFKSEPCISKYPEFTTKISKPSCEYHFPMSESTCKNPFNSFEWESEHIDNAGGTVFEKNILWKIDIKNKNSQWYHKQGVYAHNYNYPDYPWGFF